MNVVIDDRTKRPRKLWSRIFRWVFITVFVIFVIIFFTVNIYLSQSMPKITGEIFVSGLKGKVEVIRDSYGVPHIFAENEDDLYFTQGYIQAQDRLFQMDLSRRQASGRLSEVFGEAAVNNDKYFRTLGLRRAAKDSYEHYSDEAQQFAQSFTNGVNSYIEELRETRNWPIEFTILGYEPEAWSPIDSLVIGKFMAYDLGGHWEDQAFRYYLLQTFPEEKAYDLFPGYPEDAPYIIAKDELNIENSFATAVIPDEFNGSNNWVLSGEKSDSGMPILADDPHLSLNTPSIWYQMHLKSPEVNVSGVIFAGIPGIILGHNEHIAWGVTNTGPDVQDLYIEKRNPENKTEFLYDDQWEKATIIDEPIQVKNEQTIPYIVTETRHGPIISEFAEVSGVSTVLSLRWTALDPSTELEAILNMNKATNWQEFEDALLDFHTPTQNFVIADKDGTIAYKANGKIPIRKKGDGLLPVPGWTSEYDWIGYIPFDELPRVVNPDAGFISTANNKVIHDDYPYHISHNWAQPYRQMRIQQVLQEKETYSVLDMKELQMDKMNLQAREFVTILINQLPTSLDERTEKAISILKKWDYLDDKNAAAPLIFHTWMKSISDVLFSEQISEEMLALFSGRKQVVDELIRKASEGNEGPWMKEKGGLSKVVVDSLTNTMDELEELQGTNIDRWKWGEYHRVQFYHPLSTVSPLNYLFNLKRSLPVGGSSVTVQAAAHNDIGIVNHGASWRFVIDLDQISVGHHIVGPGQSGHLKSNWYQNQMKDWVEGNYHQTSLDKTAGRKLLLLPK